MKKIKMVFADSDKPFMDRLEYHIAEEFYSNADIEIITDTSYFKDYFSKPNDIDVLIVSENLFFRDLSNLNINEIVVLSEQSDLYSDSSFNVIYKYTSFEEITKQIKLYCPQHKSKKETIVSIVCSANGGAGKTTISLGVASALSRMGKKVLYINAQKVNSFQHHFSDMSPIPNSAVANIKNGTNYLSKNIDSLVRNERIDYLPAFSLALYSLGIDSSIYLDIINEFKKAKTYDVIIVDTDTALDTDLTDLITMADKVMIILNNNKNSVFSTNILARNISVSDKEKYFFVCNDINNSVDNIELPEENIDFVINDRVKFIDNIDNINFFDISNQPDIKKISFLSI